MTMIANNNISPHAGPAWAGLAAQTNPPDRILVVDDDEVFRRLNAAVLMQAGYEVDTAEDGAVAWDALNTCGYDLLVTDNIMPNLTGLELLKKMRFNRLALPVIMASGSVPEEEFMREPWLKPAALLAKPYRLADLVRAVKQVLRATVLSGGADTLADAEPSGPARRAPLLSGGMDFHPQSSSLLPLPARRG